MRRLSQRGADGLYTSVDTVCALFSGENGKKSTGGQAGRLGAGTGDIEGAVEEFGRSKTLYFRDKQILLVREENAMIHVEFTAFTQASEFLGPVEYTKVNRDRRDPGIELFNVVVPGLRRSG